jgi:uncharacterized alkaline shock family protein YloU
MAEQPLEVGTPYGKVTIHHEVIANIAANALEKVEGARPLKSTVGIMGFFGAEEGPKIIMAEGAVNVEIGIAVDYGYPVHEVAQGVQQAVRDDLERLGGVQVRRVDVYVRKVLPPVETLVLDEEKGGEDAGES